MVWTKEQNKISQKKYRIKYKDKIKRYNKKWYKDNPEWFAEYHRLYRIKNRKKLREKQRAIQLKVYGLTIEDYSTMLKKQREVCKICKKPEKARERTLGTLKSLSVDHCHKTGKVRGLLCQRCNHCIGIYELIKKDAEKYLQIKR